MIHLMFRKMLSGLQKRKTTALQHIAHWNSRKMTVTSLLLGFVSWCSTDFHSQKTQRVNWGMMCYHNMHARVWELRQAPHNTIGLHHSCLMLILLFTLQQVFLSVWCICTNDVYILQTGHPYIWTLLSVLSKLVFRFLL